MSEPRVFVDMDLKEGDAVTLPDAAYHHLVVVLRRVRDDAVTLFNGHGGEYGVTIESLAKKTVTVRVREFRSVSRESALQVTLAQAVSKGERMEYTIQKAVELGVTEIQPLVTDHVVVRLSEERWQRKQEHWQGIAVAACEQSGRTRIPRIAAVLDLRDWLSAVPPDTVKLTLAPSASTLRGKVKHNGQPVALLVGPEGGLSDMETKLSDIAGFTSLSLGPRILRTETAGVVALAMIQSMWGDLGAALAPGK
jgi:16S rRNA (uracil1498-N3)-methyltransferase